MSKHGLFWTLMWMQAFPNISPSFASGSGSQMPPLEEADADGSGSALSQSASPSPTTDPESDWESLVNEPDSYQIQPRLQAIAQDRSDPHQWKAIKRLWLMSPPIQTTEPGRLRAEDIDRYKNAWKVKQNFLRQLALPIALIPTNPHQWDAIKLLWPSRAQLSESHRTDLSQTLQEIAEDPKHPHYVEATRMFNPPTITVPSPKKHAAGRGGYPKSSFGSTYQRKR